MKSLLYIVFIVLCFKQSIQLSDSCGTFLEYSILYASLLFRMSSAPIKRKVTPNIVAPCKEVQAGQSAKLNPRNSSTAETESVGQPQNTADQAVQCAALATSAAIAPFLQVSECK